MNLSAPDSPCVSAFCASPNHEPRAGSDVDILLLHYTGMESGDAAQKRLCDPNAKVSSHYLIHEDGAIVQLVAEDRRAWHAGVASWQGVTDINSRSIGIEIVNGGHDFGLPDFPATQIGAVIRLCKDIRSRWPIPPYNVLAHSDVSPARKNDPGEKFPWQTLYEAGVGLWIAPVPLVNGEMFTLGGGGDAIATFKAALKDYGYGIDTSPVFNETTRDVVTAFQRHFRPARVDGIADISTRETLTHLLEAKRASS